MTEIERQLEWLRFAVFIGDQPNEFSSFLTQEQYVEHYEKRLERNPAKERWLIEKISAPILPHFRKQMEQMAKMEQMITGETAEINYSDREVLDELYDEISDRESETEWTEFKKRFL